MPKQIITEKTLPLTLYELDKWEGKLTWALFGTALANRLGEKSISRHTLLSYPQIVDAFNDRKTALKEAKDQEPVDRNFTIEALRKEVETLTSMVSRLEKENTALKQQFVQWQANLYMMPGVDMTALEPKLDKPLVKVDRRS